jgi:phosphotransacetylase
MRAVATQRLRQTDTFAALMLHSSDADMMIAGVSTHYVESLRTILEVIGPAAGAPASVRCHGGGGRHLPC